MPSTIDRCFEAIRKNFSEEEFSDAEIREFVREFAKIQEAAGVDQFLSKANEFRKASEKTRAEILRQRKLTAATHDLVRRDLLADIPADATPEKISSIVFDRAQNIMTAGSKLSKGANHSVSNLQKAYASRMRGRIEHLLNFEGMSDEVLSDNFSMLLRKELHSPGSVTDPRITKIGQAFKDVFEYQRQEFKRLGVDMGRIENYQGWQAYNRQKVGTMGKDGFVRFMWDKLDHEKTFKGIFTEEGKIERLETAYEHIMSGEDWSETTVRGTDPTKRRSLHYKDGESSHAVMAEIGSYPSTVHSMFAQIDYSSRRMALMNKFGPRYWEGFEKLQKFVEKVAPAPESARIELKDGAHPTGLDGILARMKALGTDFDNLPAAISRAASPLENHYEMVIGKTTAPSGSILAKTGSAHRTLVMVQKLGGAAISAVFNDFPGNVALIRSFDNGGTFGSDLLKLMKHYGSQLGDKRQRQETMALMGIWSEDMVGGISQRFGELNEGTPPGLLSDFASWMFRTTGLHQHTEIMRAATAKFLGARLATNSHLEFAQLPEQLRANLGRYNITPENWAVIRRAQITFPDGVVALSPDKILQLDGASAKLREDSYLKYAAALREVTDLGTLTGDAYTRTILYQGRTDDQITGQMLRYFSQFKQAPIQATRLMGRVYNSVPGSKLEAAAGTMSATIFMTTAGIATYAAKSMFSGVTPTDDPKKLFFEGVQRGGAAGLMGDYIMADYNRSYRNFIEDLAGPAASDIGKAVKLLKAGIAGELDENKMEAIRFAQRQVPGNNIWWAKAAYEHLLLDGFTEYLNPGYMLRTESRLKGQGQQRLFPSVGTPNQDTMFLNDN